MSWKDFMGFKKGPRSEPIVAPLYEGAADVVPVASGDPDWIIVKHHIRERLVYQRKALECRGLSHDETEGHRHAIFELEGVLNCLNPSKMSQSNQDN